MSRVPWLKSRVELSGALAGPAAESAHHVLLTAPGADVGTVSVGHALSAALRGPTRSLNMLVGFFSDGDGDADSPLGLLRAEGAEELARPWRQDDVPQEGYRLLFGALAGGSAGARAAIVAFWWLCRWRAFDPAAADAWRGGLCARTDDKATSFSRQAHKIFGLKSAPSLPLLTDDGDAFAAALPVADQERFALWRGSWAKNPESKVAAELTLFLVIRAGHVRLHGPSGAGNTESGLFHGKLYVIERDGADGADSVVVMGSPNWSTGALFGTGSYGNTEIATLLRVTGWPWDHHDPASSLAGKLVHTARELFGPAGESRMLAAWLANNEDLPAWDSLQNMLAVAEARGKFHPPPEEGMPVVRDRLDPALVPLATSLAALIRQALELNGEPPPARAVLEQHLARTEGRFAGKAIATAQSDGAIRLLSLLIAQPGTSPEGRGAFLADEAGLGKTVVAQMTAFALVLEKALDTSRVDGAWPRVTVLAPRQLVVSEKHSGPDAGQWQRHRAELIDELIIAVAALDQHDHQVQKVVAWLNLEKVAKPDARFIRVYSHSMFQRSLQPTAMGFAPDVITDLAHLAASEVVVIDEAHNLRNGGSSRTRLARFLLTLPTPGERWPIALGDSSSVQSGADPYARRVLCLTATPFNNDFEDIVTQIGHFARSQSWSHLVGKEALTRGTMLLNALHTWVSPWEAGKVELRTGSMWALIQQLTSHLKGGRRLDPEPRKSESDADPSNVADGGPYYRWPQERYPLLDPTIAAVTGVLDRLVANDPSTLPSSTETADATDRLDAMLGRLFVQRSRKRVIRLMPEDEANRQFRSPHSPRVPIALNLDEDGDGPEKQILDTLFKQLGDEKIEKGLSLFAYRISTLRAQAGGMGSGDQKATNLLGFQRVQLIKRLQSSRYSFLQTLLRGSLRRTLMELCLVERLLNRAVSAPPINGLPPGWETTARAFIPTVLQELERVDDEAHRLMLCVALSETATEGKQTIRSWLFPSSASWEILEKAFDKGAWRRILATETAKAGDPQLRWLKELVADIAKGEKSRALADIRTALHWAFTDRSLMLADIVPKLGRDTLTRIREDSGASGGTRSLLASLRRHLMPGTTQRELTRPLTEWLKDQLEDPRLAGVVGWLLAQAVARKREVPLSGGVKTLIFSEYADTVDHLAVCLQAVSVAATAERAGGKGRLARDLLAALTDTVNLVRAGTAPGQAPPLPDLAVLFGGLTEQERLDQVLRVAEGLCQTAGIRTGQVAVRLQESARAMGPKVAADAAADDDDDADEDDDVEAPEAEGLVDAFAPWYRVDPASLSAADRTSETKVRPLVNRMHAAAVAPLHTLISTEVLAEGVNLQECGVVIHFDLPWNPTRLIQRNGRVDRRIQAQYEDGSLRADLWAALTEVAEMPGLTAPPFYRPDRVYHLTVVPPEPEMEDEAGRAAVEVVRRTLFDKLRSIQLLFGLSAWPIVLRPAEAKDVLTGELDIETPGFRRREELYARLGDLALRLGEHRSAPSGGTWLLTVPRTFADALIQRLAGDTPGSAWTGLKDLGVQAGVRGQSGTPRAVRSGVEWTAGTRALTAWAWVQPDADPGAGVRFLRWALAPYTDETRKNSPIQRKATMPAAFSPKQKQGVWTLDRLAAVRLTDLEPAGGERIDLRRHPTSPTDAAEEVLDVVARWLVLEEGVEPSMVSHMNGDGRPSSELGRFDTAFETLALPAEFEPDGTGPRPNEISLDVTNALGITDLLSNLRITFSAPERT